MGATDPKKMKAPATGGVETHSEGYEPGLCEKIVNIMLCRADLAKRKMPMKPVSMRQLFRYGTRVDTWLILLGIIGAIVSGAGQPFVAVVAGGMVNVFLVENDTQSQAFRDSTYQYVYYYLGVGAALMIVAFVQACCWHVTCTRIVNRIRRAFLKSLLRQDAAWFDRNHSGALTTRLNDNIDRIQDGIGDKLGLLLRGISQFIGGLIIAFVYNWQMTLVMVVIAPLVAITMSMMSRRMSTATRKEMAVYAKAGAVAEEAISGVKTVAAFNAQDYEVKRYETELNGGKKNGIMKSVWSGVLEFLFSVIVFGFFGIAIYYGAYLFSVDVITQPGDVFVVLLAMLQGAYNLGMVSPHLMVLLAARVAAATVYDTIDRTPPIDAYSTEGKKLDNPKGKIEFRDVHFRYPSRPDTKVLQGATFTVEPGQTVALVGHSGCGKSTSVGLLTRLYEAESGSVKIDDHEVTSLNINWLRNTVGIVQQEPILFNASVEENVKIGNPEMSQEEVVRVCRMANAHDFIRKLAHGYKTRLGEGGVQLSGGQKQRMAIARTLARDPKILLLDEATSALDAQSESIVQTALDRASKGRSTIVIAHRLSTVRDASKIIVLDKGRVVEEGTHHELLALNGMYTNLVRAQQFQQNDQTILEEVDLTEDEVPAVERNRITSVTSAASRKTELRTSLRRSYRREFSQSSHKGDAEQEQMEEELQEEGGQQSSWFEIVRSTRGQWPIIAVAVLFSIVRGVVLPAFSLVYGYVFDMFNGPRDELRERSITAMLLYIGIGLANGIAAIFSVSLFGLAGENLTMQFRLSAFGNVLRQDASYFDNPAHTSGKIISRLASDAPNVKAAIDSRLAQVMQGFISMFVGIVLAFVYGWRLALVGTSLFVALGLMQFFLARQVQEKKKKLADVDEAGRVAIEAIENVQTVQLLTREQFFYQKFVDASMKQHRAELSKGPLSAIQFAVAQSLQYFIQALCYWAGVSFITQGFMTPRDVYQVIQSLSLSSLGIMNAANFFPEFVKARLAAGLMFKMIRRQPKTGDARKGDRPDISGEITFNSVFFAYPVRSKHPVLNGLSFTAGKGKTVALVGPSGSGKSTVISMLERFYDPLDGLIKFDGKDLKGISLEHVRQNMALVGQEPRLFSGSIRENIAYGLENVPMEKIEEAASLANAAKFIAGMPDGYETLVGEKGTQLSGGQKQRIAIARAIVRDPKILLLDEATSALDSESERAVQEALDKASQGRTCITIAHRLSSIQNSDLIIVVENGKVVEYGNHMELLAMRGAYYELTRKQDLSADLNAAL